MTECWLYNKCNRKDCEKDFCLRKYKLDYLCSEALLTKNQLPHVTIVLDNDKTDFEAFSLLTGIEKSAKEFVESGDNLYIYSHQCGNGKTTMAVRIMKAYFDSIWPQSELTCRGLFIETARFLTALKRNISETDEYAQHILKNIYTADIVVWDDIATKGCTEFEAEQLLMFINARLNAGKTNIYTANLKTSSLADNVGERLASRVGNASLVVELHGADKRNLKYLKYMNTGEVK